MYRSVFLADEAGKVRPYSSLELQSAQMNVDGELVFWERYGQSLTKHLVHGKYSIWIAIAIENSVRAHAN